MTRSTKQKGYNADEKQLIELYRKGKLSLATFIASHLFNAVTIDDLWKETRLGVEIDGVLYKRDELRVFSQEATKWLDSKLYKQTKKMLQQAANKKMYYKATTEADLLFGKAILYNQELEEEFLKRIAKLI